MVPSSCESVPWIFAHNPWIKVLRIKPELVGKWLLFFGEDAIDHEWDRISQIVANGLLGISAKVATKWHHENGTRGYDHSNRVVCVYTKDCTDLDDVWRVRDALRAIGHTAPLQYKTDSATIAGHYGELSYMIDETLGDTRSSPTTPTPIRYVKINP